MVGSREMAGNPGAGERLGANEFSPSESAWGPLGGKWWRQGISFEPAERRMVGGVPGTAEGWGAAGGLLGDVWRDRWEGNGGKQAISFIAS